uniref:NADH-ubiquinone oxidoreductase chain 5 n=1 Tax=Glossotermes oculatus TaxID=280691 RepID=A0A0A7E931_9NEOP|nr:NADH dehydrogenase subunit 5 [Glossotermes oculatus]URH16509.1 NADH dehydrogenase subunit 5 [Glossotermes oculatus]
MSICFVGFVFLGLLGCFFCFMGAYFSLFDLVYFVDWYIVGLNSSPVVMTLLFDWMSLLFLGFVLIISSLVVLYSAGYMFEDANVGRFIWLVLLFVASMMFLIVSPNMISILLGWDGLGLVSYCLVIYYQNVSSYGAGMLTVLSNRVGDVALLMVIVWMLNYGGWSFIYYLDFLDEDLEMELITVFIVLAAMTSSAQIPFSSWLPAAMAAPTPVSALVHSSTLVTAGVYLLIRFSPLFSGWLNTFLLLVSGLTMFMSGLGANFEYDLSSIIALSTLSQLGLMIMTVSVGMPGLAFFHLLTHALFSALLFLCAGFVIHSVFDAQDIRFMGSLASFMPYTCSCLTVSSFSLCGMPFLAGFYSKDSILEMSSMSYINVFGFFLLILSTCLTVCYSFRLFYFVFCGDYNFYTSFSFTEANSSMVTGMVGLLLMAVFGGSALMWGVFPVPSFICLPYYLKLLPLFVLFSGGLVGYLVSSSVELGDGLFSLSLYSASCFSGSMWFMPLLSTAGISFIPLSVGHYSMSLYDSGWVERFGGQGFYWVLISASSANQWFQYNDLSSFFGLLFAWVSVLFFITLY